MPEPRVGTVTFLFTDVEGSTRLVRQLRDRYPAALEDHRRLVRDAFSRHSGEEVDTQGDAFFYVFSRARDAAAAAADAQLALQAHAWPEDAELRVRMGMHTGESVISEERHHGLGVHRAARIMAAGHGGQILASQATAAMLADDELPGVEQRELGEFQLKDVDHPEHLYQLDVEGLPTTFPPLRTGDAPTAYAGKEDELAEAAAGARRPLRRRPLVIGAFAGVLAAAVAIPVFALGGSDGGGEALERVQDNAVGVVDAGSRAIIDEAPEIASPQRVAAGEGAIWVTSSSRGGSVMRLDPQSHDVTDMIEVGDGPVGIAVGAGAVWVANTLDGTVSRIDPTIGKEVEKIPVGNTPTAVAYGADAVWVTNADDRSVSKIDPVSGAVRTIHDVAAGRGIAYGDGAVWVTDPVGNALVRIDVRSFEVTDRIDVGSGPTAVAYANGAVWVANQLDGKVSLVDTRRADELDSFPVGSAPNGLAVGPDGVWVTDEVGGTLVHLDRAGKTEVTTLGGRPVSVTLEDGSLWVAVQATGAAHRGGTLKMVAERGTLGTTDPAWAYAPLELQLVSVVYDGLVGFKRVGGTDGNTLVPDLASALPTPTDNGRTYTFRLRDGIRFADGRELEASAVRYSLERLFRAESAFYYKGIVGGAACVKQPERCDLSKGVVTDDDTGIVTIRLRAPDPNFLYKLALPFASVVPTGTPAPGERPVLGTGPYRIAEHKPNRRVRLVRNRHFKVWWEAAQPEGIPNEIVLELGGTADARLAAVQSTRADLTVSGVPIARLDEVRTRYAAQLHVTPTAGIMYLMLNTKRPPFDDVSARRAVAYAVDRQRLVDGLGGSELAAPICQLLPPNFPAYRRYCPYTLRQTEDGAWTAPDLERARKLVAESGTKGMRVNVLGVAGEGANAVALSAATTVLDGTLRQLGYRTSVRRLSYESYWETVDASATRVEAALMGWIPDYPSPASMLDVPPCPSFPSWCDPAVGQKVRETLELQTRDLQAANEAWARLEREFVDQAMVGVPVVNFKAIDFVSNRVGNYQRHPLYGMLISQVWVR